MDILKNLRKNSFIILLITLMVLYFILKKDFNLIVIYLQNIDLKYIILSFLLFLIYILTGSYTIYKTVNKNNDFTLKESIKHKLIVQFFNGITPFSTGGQPMEIYMLSKHNISISKATNYILQNFIFYQIALVIFGLFAVMINNTFNLFEKSRILENIVLIGFIVNTIVAIILLFISFSKKMTINIIKITIQILSRINIIKNKEKTFEKWSNRIIEFNKCAKELKKNKKLFIFGIVLNFIGLICLYLIPLFLAYSIGDFTNLNAISAITSSAYVMVASSFIPIPGASGGIEYTFTKFFGNFMSLSKTKTILLLWRFITYYLSMILGALLFSIDRENKISSTRKINNDTIK